MLDGRFEGWTSGFVANCHIFKLSGAIKSSFEVQVDEQEEEKTNKPPQQSLKWTLTDTFGLPVSLSAKSCGR